MQDKLRGPGLKGSAIVRKDFNPSTLNEGTVEPLNLNIAALLMTNLLGSLNMVICEFICILELVFWTFLQPLASRFAGTLFVRLTSSAFLIYN